MASFTLLPLEILLNIRSHLVKPSDILILTTLNRKTYTYVDLLLYSKITIHHSHSPYKGPPNWKGNHWIEDALWKLEKALKHKPSFISSIKTLDIHLHTSFTTFLTAGNDIFTLLPHLYHLKHFRLITEGLNDQALSPARDKISPARLAMGLKRSTYKTLETLELALGRDRSHTDGTALGDLKSFVALKKLSVHSYVLLGGYDVKRCDYNPNTNTEPMLSEILPANLLHLRIHCGGADNDNDIDSAKHQRGDRDEAVAHLTEPVNWGPQKWGSCDQTFQAYDVVRAKEVRVLKSARNCFCPNGDFWSQVRELTRVSDRLDVIGEDYESK